MNAFESPKDIKPYVAYSRLNKPIVVLVIGGVAVLGVAFFAAAFRKGIGGMRSEELFLGFIGIGFLYFAWHLGRFASTPRFLIEKEFVCISDFYRKRKLPYDQILALAELGRSMRQRSYTKGLRMIPVLAIRLRSGKLLQFALPNADDNSACLSALANASGLTIESLGIDPPNIHEWHVAP